MSKDIFSKPFDDGTLCKLAIYHAYLKEWLPVFISSKNNSFFGKKVQIFDFCSGIGKDVNDTLGSPLITLFELNKTSNISFILDNSIEVELTFNEFNKDYYEQLLPQIAANKLPNNIYEVNVYQKDFKTLFEELYSTMNNSANLIFVDQNGIKLMTENIFKKIATLKQTDLLFFISSSFFNRFGDKDEFQKYIHISKEDIDKGNYYKIHHTVLDFYKKLIPNDKEYYLAPFSIKKGANIYGLIFGTNHIYGLEKFLNVCWKIDPLRGEANFDIENEKINPLKPSLFEEYNIPNKRQVFEKNLREKILTKNIPAFDLKEIYVYTLTEGFLLKDANSTLKKLKSEKKINFDDSFLQKNKAHQTNINAIITVNS